MRRKMPPIDLAGLMRDWPQSGVGKPMGGYVGPRSVMLKPPVGGSAVKKPAQPPKPKK